MIHMDFFANWSTITQKKIVRGSALLGLLIASSFSFGQTIDNKPEVRKEILETIAKVVDDRAFVPGVDFKKWSEFITNEQAKIDEAKNDDEFKSSVNAALRKFGFSHIVLATPKDWNTRQTGNTVGIGITSLPQESGRVITRVIEKGPAEEAGLEVGDVIISFEGKPVTNTTVMTGAEGSVAKLRVKKANGKTFDYEIKRRAFSTRQKDEIKWIEENKTAMIKVNSFDRAYDRNVIADFMKEAVKAKNLIIDLRSNGGGAVTNLFDFAGYFLDPKQDLGAFLDKNAVRSYKSEFKAEPADLNSLIPFSAGIMKPSRKPMRFKGNITILINGGTGSASEIFTAAMRDLYGRYEIDSTGTVVASKDEIEVSIAGTNSAGAVLFSTYAPASNGFYLQYPLADYVTPSGKRLEGNPIQPDVKIEDPKVWVKNAPDRGIEIAQAIFERARLRQERIKKQ